MQRLRHKFKDLLKSLPDHLIIDFVLFVLYIRTLYISHLLLKSFIYVNLVYVCGIMDVSYYYYKHISAKTNCICIFTK